MCTIDKLLIKGIRSFSPDNQNVIEFYRPLTLIVGHNGAGKTTIIECLKQACTGELPPNIRNGQSFVHDPKVAGESEVKAQIKLRFRTVDGAPVVVVRSFQLTQKKSAQQFKALDQTLQMVNRLTGEKVANNHRCQELDKIVPTLMGVSKAILDNVIFVHQEESNWPLGDGQTLKKKFDDIFAATKYTKALDALRKLRTEKVQEGKEMKLKLEHLSTHKDSAQRLQTQQREGEERERSILGDVDQLSREIHVLQESRVPVNEKLDHILDLAAEEEKLVTQIKEASSYLGTLEGRLRSEVTDEDLEMTVEEVQELLDNQQPQLAAMEADLLRLQQSITTRSAGLEDVVGRLARAVEVRVRLSAEADRNASTSAERDDCIREAMTTLNLGKSVPKGPLSLEQITRFEKDFMDGLRGTQSKLQSVVAAGREKDDEIRGAVESASASVTSAVESVNAKRRQLQRSEEQLATLRRQAVPVVTADMVEDAAGLVATCQAELQAQQEQWASQRFQDRLDTLAGQLASLNRRTANLRQEKDRLMAAVQRRTEGRMKQQDLRTKEGQLNAKVDEVRGQLAALLGCESTGLPPAAQLKRAVQAVLDRRKHTESLQKAVHQEARDRASQLDGQLQAARAQRQSLRNQADSIRAEIEGGLHDALGEARPVDELGTKVQDFEKRKDEDSLKISRISSLSLSYQHYIKQAQTHHNCLTCGRPFRDATEEQAFVLKQETELQRFPQVRDQLTSEIQTLEAKLGQLKLLQPKQLRLETLEGTELRMASEKVKAVERQLAHQETVVAQAAASLAAAVQDVEEVDNLMKGHVGDIDRLAELASAARAELEALGLSSQTLGLEGGRDVAAVDADLDALEVERSALERERETLQRKQDRARTEKHDSEIALQQARAAMQKAEMEAETAKAHAQRLEGLTQELAQLQQDIRLAQESMPALEEKRDRLAKQRAARREAALAEERVAKEVRQRWEDYERELRRYGNELKQYNDSRKAEQLERALADVQNLQQLQSSLEGEIKRDQGLLQEKDQFIKDHSESRRTMETLLDFKKRKSAQDAKLQRVSDIKLEMQQVGDRQRLMNEIAVSESREKELRSKQDMLRGSLGTIREQVRRAKEDLRNPNYREIDKRYRKALICLKTTEMANSDMEKYHKALEKALLAFHTTKMADINKIVKELWQKTYRSQDIDYIQIKADADATRSYNYRVVMMAGGAELDMRGRCSAGQKVLACLIIRLALAETFCLNCGILALDEPTTNLDYENSASLAEALRQIMEARRAQSNFQLIVITHDERFAQLIGTREHADHMWRVTKDANHHSIVQQQDIAS